MLLIISLIAAERSRKLILGVKHKIFLENMLRENVTAY